MSTEMIFTLSLQYKMQNIKHLSVFELNKQRPSHLLNVIVKSSYSKIRNILILPQTLWILIYKKKKKLFEIYSDNITEIYIYNISE